MEGSTFFLAIIKYGGGHEGFNIFHAYQIADPNSVSTPDTIAKISM